MDLIILLMALNLWKNKEYQLLYQKHLEFQQTPCASKIESFAKQYIDEDFVFIGNEYESKTEDSIAYISRNNSMLIDKMISFDNKNIPYNLTRSPQKMFECH